MQQETHQLDSNNLDIEEVRKFFTSDFEIYEYYGKLVFINDNKIVTAIDFEEAVEINEYLGSKICKIQQSISSDPKNNE